MSPKEDNLSAIVSLIQVVKLLRGSSFTRESYLFSTKLYYWEDQSFECPKTQLDYLAFEAYCMHAVQVHPVYPVWAAHKNFAVLVLVVLEIFEFPTAVYIVKG